MIKIKQLQNNKGVTLIEVVVSMAILAIIGVAVVNIFSTSTTTIRKTAAINEQQMIVDSVIEVISTELRYATDVTLCEMSDTTSGAIVNGRDYVYIDDNKIYMSSIDSSSEVFELSLNYEMAIDFVYESDYNITIVVSATSSYGTTEVTTSVKLLNCELKDDKVEKKLNNQDTYTAVLYTEVASSSN